MGMSFINWMGFAMLVLALILNEAFLGITAWYELNLPAIVVGIVYLVVGVSLSIWPSPHDKSA
jgi:xanthine/uracil permease